MDGLVLRLLRDEPAIDRNLNAGYVRRIVARQEKVCMRNLFGAAFTSHGNGIDHLAAHLRIGAHH